MRSSKPGNKASVMLGDGAEPVFVQAFVPELAVEALDVRVVVRLAGSMNDRPTPR